MQVAQLPVKPEKETGRTASPAHREGRASQEGKESCKAVSE